MQTEEEIRLHLLAFGHFRKNSQTLPGSCMFRALGWCFATNSTMNAIRPTLTNWQIRTLALIWREGARRLELRRFDVHPDSLIPPSNSTRLRWPHSWSDRFCGRPARFATRKEDFHRGVVPDVAGWAQAANHAAVGGQPLEPLAGALAAVIGAVRYLVRLAASPDRHQQGFGYELGCRADTHRPADRPARE